MKSLFLRYGILWFLTLPLLVGGAVLPLARAEVLRSPIPDLVAFGASVAMDGTKMLVGAEDVAFWYDDWTDPSLEPRRIYSPASSEDTLAYGGAVAFTSREEGGDKVVYDALVAATGENLHWGGSRGSYSKPGAAFLVTDITEVNGPTEQLPVVAPHPPVMGDAFGTSLAIRGGRFIVGGGSVVSRVVENPDYDPEIPWSQPEFQYRYGDVYAYDISDPTAFQSLYREPDSGFGSGVAMNDTYLLVGKTMTDGGDNGFGKAYLYEYNESEEEWQMVREFVRDDSEDDAGDDYEWDGFGAAVALSPDSAHAMIFANWWPRAAYLFDVASGEQIAKIDEPADDTWYFGKSSALSNTHAIAGTNGHAEKAWVYEYGSGSGISHVLTLTASDPAITQFGWAVALQDDTFAIGAAGAVVTGDISSMQTLDGGLEKSVKGLSFESQTDWIVGEATGGNKVLLGEGDKAAIAEDKAVYVGKDAGANGNTLEVLGTVVADTLHVGNAGNTGNVLRGTGTIAAKTTIASASTLAAEGFTFVDGSVLKTKCFTFTDDLTIEDGATLEIVEADGIFPAHVAGGELTFSGTLTVNLGGELADWFVDTDSSDEEGFTIFTYDPLKVVQVTLPTRLALGGHDLADKNLCETAGLKDDGAGRVYIPHLKNVKLRLKASPLEHAATIAGGKFPVAISSNVSWTVASSDTTWLKVPVNSGSGDTTFEVTVDPNTALTSRSGTVTITSDDGDLEPHIIEVSQAATPVLLTVSTVPTGSPVLNLNVTPAGIAAAPVRVTANTEWTAAVNPASAAWLSISATSGNTENNLGYNAAAAFTITATPTTDPAITRHGFITVAAESVTGRVARTIIVAQGPAATSFATYLDRINVWTQVDTSPSAPSITLAWDQQHANMTAAEGIFVYRRDLLDTDPRNNKLIATVPPAQGNAFVDTDVEHGKSYEYRIQRNAVPNSGSNPVRFVLMFVVASVDTPLEDQRGTVLFVVDDTLPAEMEQELRLAEMDLAGDGWNVTRIEWQQHDPAWTAPRDGNVNEYAHMKLKNKILEEYNKPGADVRALYLFGRIPVVRSGRIAPDGHAPARCVPTDTYYADIDGRWTDNSPTNTAAGENINNIAGDGKFDQNSVPLSTSGNKNVELMTGRVDFGRLPTTRKSEREHLRDYIQKTHAWKHNLRHIPYRTASNGSSYGEFNVVYPTLVALAGGPANYNIAGWSATNAAPYLFCATLHPHQDGLDVASKDSKTFFSLTLSSYQLDWYNWNSVNIIRAPLAQPEWGYLGCWGGRPQWLIHHMAAGLPAGYSYLRTVNDTSFGTANIHQNLMGDPTLRLAPARPPRNLTVSENAAAAALAWQHPLPQQPTAGGAGILHERTGYRVYRSADRVNDYELVAALPASATAYNDTDPTRPTGVNVYYQVRATYRTTVPTGVYNHQSQGVFNVLRTDGTCHETPVASGFSVAATSNAPAPLPFGGSGTAGETLTPIVVKNPDHGQIRWGGGKAHYVSNLNYTGADTLAYRLWDGLTLSDPVTIPVAVVAASHADSRLLLGWQFVPNATTNAAASTYRQSAAVAASTLTLGTPTTMSAAGIGHSNKAFAIGGVEPRATAFNPASYIAWNVAPAANTWQSLDRLAFFVFGGNRGGGYQPDGNPTDSFHLALRYSTDGFATYETLEIEGLDTEGKFNAAGVERNGGIPCSADLRGIPALQDTNKSVQFRLYFWNLRNVANQIAGLGKSAETPVQNPFDLAVFGTTSTVPPDQVRTVAFHPNDSATGLPPEPVKDGVGADILLPAEGTLVKPYHKFAGWNTQADGQGANYPAGATYTIPSQNTTLYAQWKLDPYLLWIAQNLLEGDDPAPAATPRNDGIANIVKFALGLDGSQAARYTDTGYFTTATNQSGTKLVFTYAVAETAEGEIAVTPTFSKDLQDWQPATPEPAGTSGTLNLYQAEGDFADGKGFFRLEIRER